MTLLYAFSCWGVHVCPTIKHLPTGHPFQSHCWSHSHYCPISWEKSYERAREWREEKGENEKDRTGGERRKGGGRHTEEESGSRGHTLRSSKTHTKDKLTTTRGNWEDSGLGVWNLSERGTVGGDLWYLGSAGTVINSWTSSMASKNSFSSSSSLASPFPELGPDTARVYIVIRKQGT